jgi:hypothetical protein
VRGHPFDALELNSLALAKDLVSLHFKSGEVAEVDVAVVAGDAAVALLVYQRTVPVRRSPCRDTL